MTGEFPAQGTSNAEMFPFHDVIMGFPHSWPVMLKGFQRDIPIMGIVSHIQEMCHYVDIIMQPQLL